MALNFPTNPTNGTTYSDGTSTWQYDGTAWVLLASGAGFNSFKTISGDSGSTTANSVTDTLNIVGGTGISTAVSGDTLTITNTGSGAGGGGQNIWYVVAGDSGSVVPNSTTDQLNIVGGTDITTSVANDTVTINYTGSGGGATSLNDLTDVNTQGLGSGSILVNNSAQSAFVPTSWSVDQMYMPAITMLVPIAIEARAYSFDQYGSTENPTIYAISATTIAFDLQGISGHPLLIQDPTGTNYNTGLIHVSPDGVVSTGSNAQNKDSGVLYWKVPFGISGNYRYQCSAHAPMVGAITIKAFNAI